jgi:siroheme synthase-like protein
MTLSPRNNGLSTVQYEKTEGNQLFPIFLKMNDLHTVLIGAGNVGLEKLTAILDNSPLSRITVIAKTFSPEVHALAAAYQGVNVIQKAFVDTDLDHADIVVAATNDHTLNVYIRESAHERKLLVNIADKPDLCDFYLGSVVRKGDLKVAISTNGKSPTVAKRLKEVLNESLPSELDTALQQMSELRNSLSGDFAYKVRKLNEVTSVLVDKKPQSNKNLIWLIWGAIVLAIAVTVYALWNNEPDFRTYIEGIDKRFYYFLGAGFVFALIDGAIGMSYGVTSTTFSLSMGFTPGVASMGVHLSEVMSNGIAGWMHYRMGNINWKLFKMLVGWGILGAFMGAFILSSLEDYSKYTKPFISAYTLILGIVILRKAFQMNRKRTNGKIRKIGLLGFGGGFIDAVGGGGWGSIVLSSLIAGGRHPRFSLGTVKLSRFFVAIVSSTTFIIMLMRHGTRWEAVAGLVIGSAMASPIAAKISNRLSAKTLMVAVGIIVIIVSVNSIVKFLIKL